MMMVLRQQTRLERKLDTYFKNENRNQHDSDVPLLPIESEEMYNLFVEKLSEEDYKSKVVSKKGSNVIDH